MSTCGTQWNPFPLHWTQSRSPMFIVGTLVTSSSFTNRGDPRSTIPRGVLQQTQSSKHTKRQLINGNLCRQIETVWIRREDEGPNDYMYAQEGASLNAIIWIERNKSYVVGWSMEFGCICRVQARSACEEKKKCCWTNEKIERIMDIQVIVRHACL